MDSTSRATSTEAVAALTILAMRRVDLADAHRTMGCMPEVTRRSEAVCRLGNSRECRVFGVSWWRPDGKFATYDVCLVHRWVEGPIGPLARQLPLPQQPGDEANRHYRLKSLDRGRGIALVPHGTAVYWALAEGTVVLAKGSYRLDFTAHNTEQEAAEWLHQLLLSYHPSTALVTDTIGLREVRSGNRRLTSLGIEVRTTQIDSPVESYRDFMRMERIRGVLHGVANVHCPQQVHRAPVSDLYGEPAHGWTVAPTEAEPDSMAALSCAGVAAVALMNDSEAADEA